MRPYLKKLPSQKRAGGMAQSVGSNFKTPVQLKKNYFSPGMVVCACSVSIGEAKAGGSLEPWSLRSSWANNNTNKSTKKLYNCI
jgi:hypothetical protein